VPGRTVNRMADAYRGEVRTYARGAYAIAETARHRRDLAAIDVLAQLAADLALLSVHRSDLVAGRVRMINRLREGPDRDFHLKRRGEGCKHAQAVMALARRRARMLWALLRDKRVFTSAPPVAQAA
jgi:hypothetical protein